MTSKLIMAAAAAALSAGLFASATQAAILGYATRANNFTSNVTTYTPVPLDDSGALSLKFKTKVANQLVKITYNAECGAIGPDGGWMSVQITVDGIEAGPASGTSFSLCKAETTGTYNWAGNVRQSFIVVPAAGKHTLVVNGSGQNGATSWWLGDSSVSVEE